MKAGSIFSLTPDYLPRLVAYYCSNHLVCARTRGGRDGCHGSIPIYFSTANKSYNTTVADLVWRQRQSIARMPQASLLRVNLVASSLEHSLFFIVFVS